jgi:chloramphenicol-sensitive protein RarD
VAARYLGAISGRVVGLYAIAAALIAANWFLYIYAVNAGFIVETSLGYYITPLVNVLFGVVVFHERMRPAQWVAIAIAAVGVVQLTFAYGALPWIASGWRRRSAAMAWRKRRRRWIRSKG